MRSWTQAMGGLHLGESSLAPSLARSLGPGMLLLVDQGLCGLQAVAQLPGHRRGAGVALPRRRHAAGAGGVR